VVARLSEKLKDALKSAFRTAVRGLARHKIELAFLASCLLAFLGPTYGIYVLNKLGLPWPTPDLIGFAALAAGLILIAYFLPVIREGGARRPSP